MVIRTCASEGRRMPGISYADKAQAIDIRALAMKPPTKMEIAKTIRQALDE
ncbi:MAG: hypothetical protein ABSH25_15455 [Syntrophorhabdales bacterium]|jgi:hypothetical protein